MSDPAGFMNIQAVPFQMMPLVPFSPGRVIDLTPTSGWDGQVIDRHNWLQGAIGIPTLSSDALIVLDCYVNEFTRGDAEQPISILDFGAPWTRYGIIAAGYSLSSSDPGRFSEHLMSILESLSSSGQFVNCATVMKQLAEHGRPREDDVNPSIRGLRGVGSIIMTPIVRQNMN